MPSVKNLTRFNMAADHAVDLHTTECVDQEKPKLKSLFGPPGRVMGLSSSEDRMIVAGVVLA